MSISFLFIRLKLLAKMRSLKILWTTCSKWASSKQEQFSSGFNDLEANKYNKRRTEFEETTTTIQNKLFSFFEKANIVLILFGITCGQQQRNKSAVYTRNAVTERQKFHFVSKNVHGIEQETNINKNDN